MAPLGTPDEIKYERIEDGCYRLYVYKYSKCQYTVFNLNGTECFYDAGYVHGDAIDKEKLTTEEEYYVDKQGKLHNRYRYGAVSEVMKRNRRENFRKEMHK